MKMTPIDRWKRFAYLVFGRKTKAAGNDGENPKPEIRNPKEIRSPKSEWDRRLGFGIRNSDFFRASDFGFRIWNYGLLAILATLCIAFNSTPAPPPLPKFTDVTEQAGIKFKHNLGDFDLNNIVEATGPGGMFFDYDNDGFLDIYFVNGCWHPDVSDNRGRVFKDKLTHALYHNNGDGTFADVTAKAGVACKAYGMGVVSADYDNDGYLDILVLNYGTNVLYHNNGDGTFKDVTARSGLGDPGWSVHAAWLDYNKDGNLDVFIAKYLVYDKGEFQRTGAYYKADNFPGPLSYPGAQSHLFRGNGDGTFTDATTEAGLAFPGGRAMSVVAVDLDQDGNVDLYVSNDAGPDNLWMNDGKGHFVDKALEYGTAFGEGGQGVSSMGPFIGDFDGNGRFDILVPDMGYGTLLSQVASNRFLDVTAQSGLALICGQYTGWGGLMIDFDNDGYLDVFIANGDPHHLYPEEAVLARNNGKGKFIDVAKNCGEYFQKKDVARGSVYGDFDNDGDLDILVFNLNDAPHLLRNDGGNQQPWLKIVPVLKTGQVALHSVVRVTANGLTQVRSAIAVNGYLGGNDPRPHFGLGAAKQADSVEIIWPDGRKQTLTNVPANQVVKVRREEK